LFYVFFTTKRLLSFAEKTKHICADATYKLLQHGYPLLVVGTTDKARMFHPFGIALCSNEKSEAFSFIFKSIKECILTVYNYDYEPSVLVADAAEATTNAFESIFHELQYRVMCWFHMRKAYEDHSSYAAIEKQFKEQIKQDIYTLQLCESEEIFDAAYALFKRKWLNKSKAVENFINDYFDKIWIQQHPGWYEGFAPGIPSTNNGLESNNGFIKEQATLRKRLPLGRFLEIVKNEMIEKWSKERDPISNN
jgi:hypothetical protein